MIFDELIIINYLIPSIQVRTPVLQMFQTLPCNFLLVVPAKVIIDNFFRNDDQHGCNGTRRVQWQRLDTGTCSVEYTIEFKNSTGGVIGTVTNMNNKISYCTNDYDSADSAVMWATYKGTQGNKSEEKLLTARPKQTTSRATTSRTIKQKGTNLYILNIYI